MQEREAGRSAMKQGRLWHTGSGNSCVGPESTPLSSWICPSCPDSDGLGALMRHSSLKSFSSLNLPMNKCANWGYSFSNGTLAVVMECWTKEGKETLDALKMWSTSVPNYFWECLGSWRDRCRAPRKIHLPLRVDQFWYHNVWVQVGPPEVCAEQLLTVLCRRMPQIVTIQAAYLESREH